MSPALIPMLIDGSLNKRNIFFGNGSFSDGDGQHVHRISEKTIGRQQKMHWSQKKIAAVGFSQKLALIFGLKWKKMG